MARRFTIITVTIALLASVGCRPDVVRPPLEGAETEQVALADPGVLVVGNRTWVAGTTRAPHNVPLFRSEPGTHTFSPLGDALPEPPEWARTRGDQDGAFWAPSLARLDGRYLLYFTARHVDVPADDPGWCVGVAVASHPNGPYTPEDDPLLCSPPPLISQGQLTDEPNPGRGVIDPQIYKRAGRVYLHFKALDHRWQLWGVELTSDGLATTGSARGLVDLAYDADVWEYSDRERFTILENPSMDLNPTGIRGAQYYLYYSGGDWQSDAYGTGVAACATPLGPCLRTTDPAWLRSFGAVGGPGGLTVVRDLAGQRWAFHHAWSVTDARRRVLHAEPLDYDGIVPVLLYRRPIGDVQTTTAEIEPSTVIVSGTANDPDRLGGEVAYRIRVDGERVYQRYTTDNTIDVTITGQYGPRTVCVDLRDDIRLGWAEHRCVAIDGGEAPPESSPPPPPSGEVPTTTSPPTTDGTTPSTTTSTTEPVTTSSCLACSGTPPLE